MGAGVGVNRDRQKKNRRVAGGGLVVQLASLYARLPLQPPVGGESQKRVKNGVVRHMGQKCSTGVLTQA